jgi:beta-phosphoglucomutase-like phosphatase (HAD superfamily)
VVTSGGRALAQTRLAFTGLPVPAVFVTADDVRSGKPAPDGYLLAAARLADQDNRMRYRYLALAVLAIRSSLDAQAPPRFTVSGIE